MRLRAHPLVLLGLLLAAGCPAPESHPADGGAPEPGKDAGPCAEKASLYGIDVHDEEVALAPGATLPITLGFQGFQYIRIGLRTQMTVPQTLDVWVEVTIVGSVERTTGFAGVQTRPAPAGGTESVDVSVMFNDVPLAELIGKKAALRVWTTTPGCKLVGETEVLLVTGAYQGPDGGLTYDGG